MSKYFQLTGSKYTKDDRISDKSGPLKDNISELYYFNLVPSETKALLQCAIYENYLCVVEISEKDLLISTFDLKKEIPVKSYRRTNVRKFKVGGSLICTLSEDTMTILNFANLSEYIIDVNDFIKSDQLMMIKMKAFSEFKPYWDFTINRENNPVFIENKTVFEIDELYIHDSLFMEGIGVKNIGEIERRKHDSAYITRDIIITYDHFSKDREYDIYNHKIKKINTTKTKIKKDSLLGIYNVRKGKITNLLNNNEYILPSYKNTTISDNNKYVAIIEKNKVNGKDSVIIFEFQESNQRVEILSFEHYNILNIQLSPNGSMIIINYTNGANKVFLI